MAALLLCKEIASNALNILLAGSLFYGVFWILFFWWLAPAKDWLRLWMMFIFITFLAYGHEALKKCFPKQQTIAERYEQIKNM